MSKKQVEIVCPCCSSRLAVDVLTERVLRALPPEKVDETGRPKVEAADWDRAFGRVQDRSEQSLDKMESALERERSRESDLDDLFRKAKERAEQGDEDDVSDPGGSA